jgi:uncharacterized cupin superfamily protein
MAASRRLSLLSRARSACRARRRATTSYEETIYGLDGVMTWTVNGKAIDVGPGQTLCIPRGAIHRFDNHGDRDVKALCVITPGRNSVRSISARLLRCSERRLVVHLTGQGWWRSCAATA